MCSDVMVWHVLTSGMSDSTQPRRYVCATSQNVSPKTRVTLREKTMTMPGLSLAAPHDLGEPDLLLVARH